MMNDGISTLENEASPRDPMKSASKRRRFIWIVVLVLAGLLLLVALTPTILSMGPFRRIALRTVNNYVNGTVDMKSWSLGWVSGFRFRGIKVADEQGESVIEADAVIVRTTAFALLGDRKNLRVIEVRSPIINVVVNEDGTTNLESLIATPEPESDAEEVDIRGRVLVQEGIVNVRLPAYDSGFVLSEMGVDVGMTSLKEPLSIQMTGKLGEEKAQLVVTGTASMPMEDAAEASGPEATLAVNLDGFALASISQLARRFGSPVDVAGKANLALEATLSSSGDIHVVGDSLFQSLALVGESRFLQDKPVFPKVVTSFNIRKTGNEIHIADFAIESAMFTSRALGTLRVSPEEGAPMAHLAISGQTILPEVVGRFPKALSLRQGLLLESGTVAFDVDVKSVGTAAEGDLSVSVRDLAAVLDGKRIELDAPVEMKATGMVDAEGQAKLSMLHLSSSFMKAEGKGDQTAFEATLTSDLEVAMREVSKFADVGGKTLSGKAEVLLKAEYTDPSRPRVSASLELDRLAMRGFVAKPIEMPDAGISFEAVLVPSQADRQLQVRDITGKCYVPIGSASFSLDRVTNRKQGLPAIVGGQVNGKVKMGDMVALLRYLEFFDAQVDAHGDMEYSCQFASTGDVITIADLHAVSAPLKITGNEIPTIQNDRVVLNADMTLRPETESVEVSQFDFVSSLAQVKGSAKVSGTAEARVLESEGEIKCDFDQIGPLVATFTEKPIQLHGSAFRPYRIRATLGGADWREMLRMTEASAGTYMTSAGLPPLETGPVEVGTTISDGRAICKISTLVSGANVNLPLVIDALNEPMVLTMPADTMVLEDAQFSTGLADGLVSKVVPLFKGCVVTAGSVDFACRKLSAPMDETAMQQASMQAGLSLKGVRLGSAGFLSDALDLFGIGGYGIELPDQEVAISLKDGRVEQNPITIQVSRYVLTLSGSVGLVDTDLDMLLKVPLTREMVGSDAYEILKDEALEVFITGTADAPQIQRDIIRSNIDRMIKSSVRDVVEEKAKDLIKDEVNKLLKDAFKGL